MSCEQGLRLDHEGLEIGVIGEVRGHGVAFQADPGGEDLAHHPVEGMIREAAAIGGAEKPAPGSKTGCGEGYELSVVLLGAEDLAPMVA